MTTTITTADLSIDMYQGRDAQDRKFGYVGCDADESGYFFTWHSTLEDTLDSLDGDEMAQTSHDRSDVAREYLESKTGAKFAASYAD